MRVISFRDQTLHTGEWALLFACYIIPGLNLLFLSLAWFLYPLFALLILLLKPRNPLVRFHFLQAFFCFLGLILLVVLTTLFSAFNGNRAPYIQIALAIFWLVPLCYLLLTLFVLFLLITRRSLILPLVGSLAERYASRKVRPAPQAVRAARITERAQESEEGNVK